MTALTHRQLPAQLVRRMALLGLAGFGACSRGVPDPDQVEATVTVKALAYGRIERNSTPASDIMVRAWAHRDRCRTPMGAGDITLSNPDGTYRRVIEVLGSLGRGCVTLRFYFAAGSRPDSLVIVDRYVEFRSSLDPAGQDSVRVDVTLP